VVCSTPPPSSTFHWIVGDRYSFCGFSYVCTRPWGRLHLDSDMSMDTHLSRLVSSCFGVLRQIRCIRRSLPRSSLATLMAAFILSKVDYCNVVLAGLPKRDLDRLQSVINVAARLTTGTRRHDHVIRCC